MGGVGAAAGGLLAAELCAPLLLLCWLCCWPDDASSDSTSGKHPQRPVLAHVHESGSRWRSSDLFGRRIGSSAVSLHLPGTSGYKKPLSAHRSHEEIGSRRKSTHDGGQPETRYHSAPSVIDEVLHRRDWERSTRDLHIPLRPNHDHDHDHDPVSSSSDSPDAPRATPESSSIEEGKSDEHLAKTCKKHHTNIKSSRGKKEKESTDIKDDDATEASSFYIGENNEEGSPINKNTKDKCEDVHTKSIYKAKVDKQSLNESIRSKEHPRHLAADDVPPHSLGFCLDDVIEQLDRLGPLDRSGATHHTLESRLSLSNRHLFPPPSVEPVGYDGGACYLAEEARAPAAAAAPGAPSVPAPATGAPAPAAPAWPGVMRARYASDGDILGPPHRPESGAFSESDLDLDLEGTEERPPSYEELQNYAAHDHKETAI